MRHKSNDDITEWNHGNFCSYCVMITSQTLQHISTNLSWSLSNLPTLWDNQYEQNTHRAMKHLNQCKNCCNTSRNML